MTQRAQGEGNPLPGGITLLADPEYLNHQEDPLEEHQNGNSQHDPLLRGPGSNTDNGKNEETSRPHKELPTSTICI